MYLTAVKHTLFNSRLKHRNRNDAGHHVKWRRWSRFN